MNFQHKVKALETEIEDFENELSLACLDLNAYNPALVDRLKDWEKHLFQFKIDLLGHEKPDINQCHFSLYGTGLEKIIKIYQKIFTAKNIEVEAQTVWFNEKKAQRARKGIDKYIKKKWDLKELILNPALDGSILYGIEMKLKGSCVLLYLKEESGNHRWNMSANEDHSFVIEVSEDEIMTPAKINRKDFYRGSLRRVFRPGHLKDTQFKINREIAKNQFDDIILQILDERFKIKLDGELL